MKKISVLILFVFIASLANAAVRNDSKKAAKQTVALQDAVTVNKSSDRIIPNGEPCCKNVEFYIALPDKKMKVKKWDFSIVNNSKDNEVVYNLFGSDNDIPSVIVWNGKTGCGEDLEGSFGYVFTADIDKENIEIAEDNAVLIDMSAPYVSLSLTKDTLFADKENNKFENPMSIALNVGDENKIDMKKTKLCINGAKNKAVKEWNFEYFNNVPGSVSWDGTDDVYGTVVPAGDYSAVLTAYDIFGNSSSAQTQFTVFEKIRADSKIVVKEEPRGLLVNLSSNVLFATSKSVLKKEATSSLDETVNLLNIYPANKVLIEGYTDSTGIEEKNLKLSYDRAQAVYAYLVKKGIKAERLTAVGYGSKNPVADNKTAVGRAQNRRVNIIILKNTNKSEEAKIEEVSNADNAAAGTVAANN